MQKSGRMYFFLGGSAAGVVVSVPVLGLVVVAGTVVAGVVAGDCSLLAPKSSISNGTESNSTASSGVGLKLVCSSSSSTRTRGGPTGSDRLSSEHFNIFVNLLSDGSEGSEGTIFLSPGESYERL